MPIPLAAHASIKENSIGGRYVTHSQIQQFFQQADKPFSVHGVGASVEGRSIQTIQMGSGPLRVLMWSQMHGNESTTTKAVLDLLNFLGSDEGLGKSILRHCTLQIIPMLNPDGAEAYTRANAKGVDLNRDALDRSQPESRVLHHVYEDFKPDFCFNLHDQRTIFNVGDTDRPATVSFLAPAHDEERSISSSRETSMRLIAAMNQSLQTVIPGQVGRYDDAFNANCVGDTFQMLGTPTLLFEAGHFPNDYQREKTRELIFLALLKALHTISEGQIGQYARAAYFEIPENRKQFFDIVIRNVHLAKAQYPSKTAWGILFRETLDSGTVHFKPNDPEVIDPDRYFGHQNYDCADQDDLEDLNGLPFWSESVI